jgi:hypothetical protein
VTLHGQRRWTLLAVGLLALVGLLLTAAAGPARDGLEARVEALEVAVEQLQAAVARPAPPTTTQVVNGFTFQRVGVIQQSTSSYAEVVGEVIAPRTEQAVRLRATLYAGDGSIIATEPFSVNVVADEPRAFDVLMIGVQLTESRVASIGLQVE